MQTKLEKAQKWAEINKMNAETNKLNAEADKLRAEARKLNVETSKAEKDLKFYFVTTISVLAGIVTTIYRLIINKS